jgi:hypothetical protein
MASARPRQRLGLRMAVRVVEQLGEIVEAYRHIGMIRVGGWFRGRVLDGVSIELKDAVKFALPALDSSIAFSAGFSASLKDDSGGKSFMPQV